MKDMYTSLRLHFNLYSKEKEIKNNKGSYFITIPASFVC